MPFIYRWARGEKKAIELAEKVSGCKGWRQMETIATCGGVKARLHEYMLEGDKYYKDYWLLYQPTSDYPEDYAKWHTTIGWCTDGDFPQLPIQRLKDGLEKVYR